YGSRSFDAHRHRGGCSGFAPGRELPLRLHAALIEVQSPIPDIERIALRKSLREKRAAIPAAQRIAAATALIAQLEAIPEYITDTNVAGYWAVDGELPLASIMGGLRNRGQVYHLPVVDDQK